MAGYLAGRLALTLLTVFLALTFMFGVLHMAGDPVLLLVPVDSSAEHIERMRVEWGFADPLWVQYGRFLGRALAGDFGTSLSTIFRRSTWSWSVCRHRPPHGGLHPLRRGAGVAARLPGGYPGGAAADRLSNLGSVLGQSIPSFWLGLLLSWCSR